MATKSTAFRFPDDVLEKLDCLADMQGVSRTEYLISSIVVEYDRVQGNPELMKAFENLKAMQSQLNALIGKQ